MKKPKKIILFILVLFTVLFLLYVAFVTKPIETVQESIIIQQSRLHNLSTLPSHDDYNVWLIFTKVSNRSSLVSNFANLISNLLNVSSLPIKFHIIVDLKSKNVAEYKLSEIVHQTNKSLAYHFYYVQNCAPKISDIVNTMTPFFSSKPGTYYSDALFYISLGLYRIAPVSQKKAILLDCDLYFKYDIALLFEELGRFKSTEIFGLAPELTPVYRHILHMYKQKHKTTLGEFYHDVPISPLEIHPRGFQGYNSGVVLIDFEKQRISDEFSRVIARDSVRNMTEKYNFRGHLGDQDFYTLLGFQHPHLIHTLNCGFNRQLCTWWRDHGYKDIFDNYFKCQHPIVVLHGNCNTKIPKN